MKRNGDRAYRAVLGRYDYLLWISIILAFGTKLLNAAIDLSSKAELTLYSSAGFLLALYICLAYGRYLKRK